MAYYSNVNPDLLASVPQTARHVLELGCGTGQFGRAYKARNPQANYVGIECFASVGEEAKAILDHVVVGDIEVLQTMAALDSVQDGALFDTVILGDVLEHLHNPWQVLKDLRARTTADGVCVACIPNIAHWSVVLQQLGGRWDYADSGLLDRTHLRFFTLHTAAEAFKNAGWNVLDAKPRILWPDKTEAVLKELSSIAKPLGLTSEQMRQNLSAFQWIIRAVNGPASNPPLRIAGVGIRDVGGVTKARIDHPFDSLSSLVTVRAVWGYDQIVIPSDWPSGVFVLQRKYLQSQEIVSAIERKIGQGWVIVSEIDDDPRCDVNWIESDFYAFRAVHAVTTSTETLARLLRQWNPNVQVFPNAISFLPEVSATTPKQGNRLRIFFGALNRSKDWGEVGEGIMNAARQLGDVVEFVVVHDRVFHDALPGNVIKVFHPTLPYAQYMDVLSSCDIALLPLQDTAFNRMKSDLKFIECCAANVVPICSPVVYAECVEHQEIGIFASASDEWRDALVHLCQSPTEIIQRRKQGLAYIKRERMHCHQIEAREAYYRSLIAERGRLEIQRQERLKALA